MTTVEHNVVSEQDLETARLCHLIRARNAADADSLGAQRASEEGERAAMNLLKGHKGLVKTVVKRYRSRLGGGSLVGFEDLESVANEAMLRAAGTWEPSEGPWLPYTKKAMCWAIQDYLNGTNKTIRIPKRQALLVKAIADARLEAVADGSLCGQSHDDWYADRDYVELANRVSAKEKGTFSPADIRTALQRNRQTRTTVLEEDLTLDTSGDDELEDRAGSAMEPRQDADEVEVFCGGDPDADIWDLVALLPDLEREVIVLRLQGHTQETAALQLRVSPSTVRRRINNAIVLMKDHLNAGHSFELRDE